MGTHRPHCCLRHQTSPPAAAAARGPRPAAAGAAGAAAPPGAPPLQQEGVGGLPAWFITHMQQPSCCVWQASGIRPRRPDAGRQRRQARRAHPPFEEGSLLYRCTQERPWESQRGKRSDGWKGEASWRPTEPEMMSIAKSVQGEGMEGGARHWRTVWMENLKVGRLLLCLAKCWPSRLFKPPQLSCPLRIPPTHPLGFRWVAAQSQGSQSRAAPGGRGPGTRGARPCPAA